MRLVPIYATCGRWEALLAGRFLYNTQGEWIGWIEGRDAYTRDGEYVGFLSTDQRIVRRRIHHQRPLKPAPTPLPPLRIRVPSTVPLPPLFPELPWEIVDALEEEESGDDDLDKDFDDFEDDEMETDDEEFDNGDEEEY